MTTAHKLGTVNGYVRSTGWIGRKSFQFDGTIKDLTRRSLRAGATAGTKVRANIGGRDIGNAREFTIIAAPHDDRANGFWAI